MKSKKDIITIGFALFAMFFGAGNLLLPPYLGMLVGDNYIVTILAFALTGILLPLLGIIAVTISGDYIEDMEKWVNRGIITVLGVIIMLLIGPLIAIPRTAATTYEVGLLPLFPGINPILSSILFFTITFFLSISSSKVVDIIGKYLTPVLLITLFSLIMIGLFFPLGVAQVRPQTISDNFSLGFVEGYQTVDALAALIFAGVIITAAKLKGYTTSGEKIHVVVKAGILASLCLLFIYGGLVFLGSTSGIYDPEIKRSNLLLHIAQNLLGGYGTIIIAICIGFACLTTAIALTSAFGLFFQKLLKGRISYGILVAFCCIFSGVLAIAGVDDIITYAYPFLAFVYPIAMALVIYVILFNKRIKQKEPYIGAVISTTVYSLILVSIEFLDFAPQVFNNIKLLPLYDYEIAWLLPSAIGFILGYLVSNKKTDSDSDIIRV